MLFMAADRHRTEIELRCTAICPRSLDEDSTRSTRQVARPCMVLEKDGAYGLYGISPDLGGLKNGY